MIIDRNGEMLPMDRSIRVESPAERKVANCNWTKLRRPQLSACDFAAAWQTRRVTWGA